MGLSRPLFIYFRFFLVTISIQIEKSIDGVLGIRTRGHRMVGADETTELWQPPKPNARFKAFWKCFEKSNFTFIFQVPCPRHRLPKYDETTDKVGMSFSVFKKSDLKGLGNISLRILKILRLVHLVNHDSQHLPSPALWPDLANFFQFWLKFL